MRRTLHIMVVTISLFLAIYSGLWLYATNRTKSMLKKISSYAKSRGLEFTYSDIITYGFPFSLELYLKTLKIASPGSTSVKLDSLSIKYNLFSKWLFLSIPSNVINITLSSDQENYNIACNIYKLALILKLNELPFLLQIKNESSILDCVNLLRYEDYGLVCTSLSDNNRFIRSDKGNHLQLVFDKKSSEHIKFNINSHISKYIENDDYSEVNANFDVEILSNKSNIKLNLDIEKFSINGNNFAINIKGKLHDFIFTALSYSFKDEINIDMLNYKECISFLASQYLLTRKTQTINNIQELVLNAARRINDNDIRITLSYNKAAYIGNMQFNSFMDKIHKIYDDEGKVR